MALATITMAACTSKAPVEHNRCWIMPIGQLRTEPTPLTRFMPQIICLLLKKRFVKAVQI